MQLLIHGTVPLGSGLSSSSSLVVAVAVAILAAYGCSATQADVATFTCSAERYVGVNSGGMDQAISVMARPGASLALCALLPSCFSGMTCQCLLLSPPRWPGSPARRL